MAYWITHNVLTLLDSNLFEQERVGLGGTMFKMLKVQTMDATDIPLQAVQKLGPVATAIRRLALDELVQVTHVSSNPDIPGPMSVIGPRPQLPAELEHMHRVMHAAGEAERFYKWIQMYTSMRPGIFGMDSFIGDIFIPGSYELYDARIQTTEWYYHNASQVIDLGILGMVVAYGAQHLPTALTEAFEIETKQHRALY